MATGIAKPGTRTATTRIARSFRRPRVLFALALVVALFASATSAFGATLFNSVAVSGNSWVVGGGFYLDGANRTGVIAQSNDDGATWTTGFAPSAYMTNLSLSPTLTWGLSSTDQGVWKGLSPDFTGLGTDARRCASSTTSPTTGSNAYLVGHRSGTEFNG